MRSGWGEDPRLQFWTIIIKSFRNMKKNIIFLAECVSSVPKFNEDQIKPPIEPLVKSKKIDRVWGISILCWRQPKLTPLLCQGKGY